MYLAKLACVFALAASLAACGSSTNGTPFCILDKDCDDGDPCTEDRCDKSTDQCQNDPLGWLPGNEGPPDDPSCANGIDDDCDGRTDKDDQDCAGTCVSNSDCDDQNPCTDDSCDSDVCYNDPVADQTACDDDKLCTSGDSCLTGVCQGLEMDCSHLDTQCTQGYCNEYLQECAATNLDYGTPCQLDDPCAVTADCREGECVGNNDKDEDGDGFVDQACLYGTDCNDDDPTIHPDAVESPPWGPLCADGIDNDCTGLADALDYSCMQELGLCDASGWCFENPLPQGNHLNGVWALGPDDIWAAGDHDTVIHWDGTGWYRMSSMRGSDRGGIWAAGPDRVWTTRQSHISMWDGSRWRSTWVTSHNLYSLWGSSDLDIWAGGAYYGGYAILYHFDGNEWHNNNLTSGGGLGDVWGLAQDDVWAVGGGPRIWHYDGSAWSAIMQESGGYLSDVWASGPDDAWAVGDDAAVFRFDGDTWNVVDLGVTSFENFSEVWGSSPNDVWISGVRSGKYALLHHFDGLTWSEPEDLHGWIGDALSLSDTDSIAVGQNGLIIRWNGSIWEEVSRDVVGSWMNLGGGCSPPENDSAWLVGESGSIIQRDAASGYWNRVESGVASFLYDVWCPSTEVAWAVGTNSTILRWDGSAGAWNLEDPGIQATLRAVWGTPAGDEAWAVGMDGVTLHFSAGNWTQVPSGTPANLVGVWGSSPGNVWAISEQGPLLHWDGASWTLSTSPTSQDLNIVYGLDQNQVWIGGDDAALYQLNPASGDWEQISLNTSENIQAIWARSADDLWVAAYDEVWHWDGETWEQDREDHFKGICALWGNPQGDLWSASSLSGRILHRLPK